MMRPTRLLVVDDDDAYRGLLVATFEAAQGDVVVHDFADPGVALRWIRDHHTHLDCVVSDYRMPGLTGGDLLVALREAGIDLPFVLVSGSPSREIPESTRDGVTTFVQKGARDALETVRTAVGDALNDESVFDRGDPDDVRHDGGSSGGSAPDIYLQTANPGA